MDIRVVNLKVEQADIIIDRRSRFGNPIIVGRECIVCDEVHGKGETLQCYRVWLWDLLNNDVGFIVAFKELVEVMKTRPVTRLGCWCKPNACHGDILKKAILWYVSTH